MEAAADGGGRTPGSPAVLTPGTKAGLVDKLTVLEDEKMLRDIMRSQPGTPVGGDSSSSSGSGLPKEIMLQRRYEEDIRQLKIKLGTSAI